MSKRFLIDFEDDLAVVYFQVGARVYTITYMNKFDLWDFFQKSPAVVAAKIEANEIRERIRAIAFEQKISIHEASIILARMDPRAVTYITKVGQIGRKTSALSFAQDPNFNISNVEF